MYLTLVIWTVTENPGSCYLYLRKREIDLEVLSAYISLAVTRLARGGAPFISGVKVKKNGHFFFNSPRPFPPRTVHGEVTSVSCRHRCQEYLAYFILAACSTMVTEKETGGTQATCLEKCAGAPGAAASWKDGVASVTPDPPLLRRQNRSQDFVETCAWAFPDTQVNSGWHCLLRGLVRCSGGKGACERPQNGSRIVFCG